jgi:glycosyltransferase involved in cell wall biosynthesis
MLNGEDAGIACANGEDDQLLVAALLLASDDGIRERMGRNARALGENIFSVRVIAKQILSSVFGASGNVEILARQKS